ncbi:hypothetical protein K443DRAFT_10382 [Laccaria amethystina LaAM-08-1]|uniref:Uncharacterized protein n=1 Tax=Laccaria amethystina LaAM-08-1 TaxID=1095629 RepID=A0A0C9WKX6_9AGAR|nr:hypothetical protein K443DRAFT_10382 [Laccaria amethystina LaAM-08-1]
MAQPSSACLAVLDAVSIALETSTLSLSDYVVTLLKYQALWDHPSTVDLVNNTTKIMTAFLDHLDSKISAFDWASTIMRKKYSVGIKLLVSCEEWHFNTSHASAKELEDFWIEDMAITMKRLAPDLWLLLDMLLMGDRKCPAESLTIDLDEDYVIMSLYSLCGLPKVAPPPWWLIVYTSHLDVSYADPTLLTNTYPPAYITYSYAKSSRPSPPSYADSIPNRVTTPELRRTPTAVAPVKRRHHDPAADVARQWSIRACHVNGELPTNNDADDNDNNGAAKKGNGGGTRRKATAVVPYKRDRGPTTMDNTTPTPPPHHTTPTPPHHHTTTTTIPHPRMIIPHPRTTIPHPPTTTAWRQKTTTQRGRTGTAAHEQQHPDATTTTIPPPDTIARPRPNPHHNHPRTTARNKRPPPPSSSPNGRR